jgi:RNA polymerase sigma-70 factor (ECF subfamily)
MGGWRIVMVKQADYLELVEQARSGRWDSMNELGGLVRARVYPCILRAVSNRAEAEDLLQEVLLTVVRSLGRLEQIDSFWSWVYKIARTRIQQHFRDRQRRESVRAAFLRGSYRCESHRECDALEAAAGNERHRLVSAAIGTLKRQHQDVLRLRCFEGLSFSEIAELTGSSYQQVRVRFFRAKRCLRQQLRCAAAV